MSSWQESRTHHTKHSEEGGDETAIISSDSHRDAYLTPEIPLLLPFLPRPSFSRSLPFSLVPSRGGTGDWIGDNST